MNKKEQAMNEVEYAEWVAKDTAIQILYAVAIYAVALIAYWTLVD
jgi:flagellar biosynthesis/type III secretory pathway M-ring protein FliF/YscJ